RSWAPAGRGNTARRIRARVDDEAGAAFTAQAGGVGVDRSSAGVHRDLVRARIADGASFAVRRQTQELREARSRFAEVGAQPGIISQSDRDVCRPRARNIAGVLILSIA